MPFELPGSLFSHGTARVLVYGLPNAPLLSVRPGYHFFFEADYLLPHEIIDDIGQHLTAPACYTWLEERGDWFPRADAIGMRPSGQRHTAFLKELDLTDIAVFAGAPGHWPMTRLDLAFDLTAPADGLALAPTTFPIALLDRGVICYRIAPRAFEQARDFITTRLLATGRTDWRATFAELPLLK